MPLRRKIGVIAVFLTGFTACIASSLGVFFRWKLVHSHADLTYNLMPATLTCLVEMTLGVSASCMPAMSNMLHHLPSWDKLSSMWTSRFSSNRERSPGSSPSQYRNRNDYKGLKDSNVALRKESHEMAPVKSLSDYLHTGSSTEMRTYVHTGDPSEMEEDCIYLQYNVEQESNI
ncbi:MAG: hypothetical protein Q9161_004000 [Pseudevernia consocians]